MADPAKNARPEGVYSPLNPAALFLTQRRLRLVREIFARAFPNGPGDVRLLEIGCGEGRWIVDFMTLGLSPANLSGIDLDPVRSQTAARRIAAADIRHGDAAALPWPDQSFDVVFQSTVFTSVLDDAVRRKIAAEMRRVCRPSGFILWYDFAYDNPSNAAVRGVKAHEIAALFAPRKTVTRKVTLAPPIARRVVPLSWTAAELLETFCPFLRTHILAEIKEA